MAGEDEIIQKFRVVDEGAVQTLSNIDKQMQQVRGSSESLNRTVQESGKQMESLPQHHLNARHALSMLASQTGMATSELMHFYHAVTMIPGPMGIALGATMMLKAAFEKQREQEEKNIETHEAFIDSYGKQIQRVTGNYETGSGGEWQDKIMSKNDEINKQIRERVALESIMIKSTNERIRIDDLSEEIKSNQDLMTMLMKRHTIENENTKEQIKLEDEMFESRASRLEKWTGDKATQKANELNDAAEMADKEAALADKKYEKYAKNYGEDSPMALEALKNVHAKELTYLEAVVRQKEAVYNATEKYNKAMREARVPMGAVDPYNREAQIKSKYEISDAEAVNKLYEKRKEIIETVGLTEQQQDAMIKSVEDRAASEKTQRQMNEEKELKEFESNKLSFAAQMREETLRIKGDSFSAEKEQLEEWHRKELLEHRDQADKINALYGVKLADLQRRRGQQFADTMQGYQNQITGATLGSAMAQIQGMQYEHEKKQAEYARMNTPEAKAEATLENQAYAARIHEMQREGAHKLLGEQKVGFMEAGGAWEAFSRGLNQDPFKMEQRAREIEANNLLTSIDKKLGNKPVMVG